VYGLKWSIIAQLLPGREPKQCRERFLNVIDPSKTRQSWTKEEDSQLVAVHDCSKKYFAQTAKHFPNRSYNEVSHLLDKGGGASRFR
jgi:hypothetical protein